MSSESDDNSGYNSDRIDSDIEIQLYGAIHHSMPTDGHESATDCHNSALNPVDSQPKSDSIGRPEDWMQTEAKTIESTKPLNNLFRLLDQKLDESDCEFNEDFDFNVSKVSNKRKIELIEISDSSDDSDIAIIVDKNERIFEKKMKTKSKRVVKTKTDISLGNVSNFDESLVSAMNQFYDEDVYDSEEEEKSFNSMSEDKRFWKINYNDLLLSRKESNRYYRNRFICNNCHERGHQTKECPLPKKSPLCYLCGLTGHRSDRCKSMLCSRCLSDSHRTINCNIFLNELICEECGDRGHETNQCTYNWRKFHSTTTSTPEEPTFSNLSPNVRKCCYNCGLIGKHFGYECRSKSMTKHMIPVSPLMLNPRKSHCFNGRDRNNSRNDCNQKAFSNEFVKSISSNELSCLSASFNKPLDQLDLCSTSATVSASTSAYASPTTAQTSNNKNKHIKWIYPELNGTDSSTLSYVRHSSPIELRTNCQKNKAIGERRDDRIFNDYSPLPLSNASTSSSTDAIALYSHRTHTPTLTLTSTPTLQQINNSMLEKSQTQTQTTPQLNERSKRRNNRRKRRQISLRKISQQLMLAHSNSNITENRINNTLNALSGLSNQKPRRPRSNYKNKNKNKKIVNNSKQ